MIWSSKFLKRHTSYLQIILLSVKDLGTKVFKHEMTVIDNWNNNLNLIVISITDIPNYVHHINKIDAILG